jgi:hypothetical protein
MSASAYLGRLLGHPVTGEKVIHFTSALRSHNSRLTDRAACVLCVLAHSDGPVSVKDIEVAIGARQGVIWAVLKGLAVDLGLIAVNGTGWTKTASLTDAGETLVKASRQLNTCAL